ncbi:MAG TPA: hypothetical protein PKC32_00200 [Sphingopyxis sp.]|jgi:hypothetical protein|nr:hypothetical protein [Sphingopyxis sp.]
MRRSVVKIAAPFFVALAAIAVPANAASGDLSSNSSSGSVTFTVIIPPLGPAIRAANAGAVGLWTIADANEGLMIRVNDQGAKPTLSLFHREGAEVLVSLSGQGSRASLLQSANDGGLESEHYGLAGLQAGVNVFTISAL